MCDEAVDQGGRGLVLFSCFFKDTYLRIDVLEKWSRLEIDNIALSLSCSLAAIQGVSQQATQL